MTSYFCFKSCPKENPRRARISPCLLHLYLIDNDNKYYGLNRQSNVYVAEDISCIAFYLPCNYSSTASDFIQFQLGTYYILCSGLKGRLGPVGGGGGGPSLGTYYILLILMPVASSIFRDS